MANLDEPTPYELKTYQERTDLTPEERAYLSAGWIIEWIVTNGTDRLHRDHFFVLVDGVKAMRVLLDENARLRAELADLKTARGIFGRQDDGAEAGSLGLAYYQPYPHDGVPEMVQWQPDKQTNEGGVVPECRQQ